MQQETAAEEAVSRAHEQISGARLKKMEQENKQLEQNFQSELTELRYYLTNDVQCSCLTQLSKSNLTAYFCTYVRQVEARMVELSQLLGMFTGKLQEQQEHVDEIHEAAVGTTVNVEKVSTHAESYHLHQQPLRNCWV